MGVDPTQCGPLADSMKSAVQLSPDRVTIAVMNFDLAAALEGRVMGVLGSDGQQYNLRLMTPDEAFTAMESAQQEGGVEPPLGGNRQYAERLTQRMVSLNKTVVG